MRVERESQVGVKTVPAYLSHLILDVQDIDRSLAFYSGLLHLPVSRQDSLDGHRLAYLHTGATSLLLLQQPKADQNPLLDRSGGMVIKFQVQDLPHLAKSLERGRVHVLRGLEIAEQGEKTFLVADPDGYAVLLTEPVGSLH
ncbi:MAG TPA: VOC family protein [Fimbriimonadaceae bacterium]|nr:VOC family protein [Fimbriimonadaceae bacterium]